MKQSPGVVPSLIKWTGSKRSQAAVIAAHAPAHRRYREPFLGGGAVLYRLAAPGAVAGDVYAPLIQLWQRVQQQPETLVEDYRRQWHLLRETGPEYFYTVRERFNAGPNPLDLNFLLRTCVNGIVRFNEAGRFNNSFHLTRPGMDPDRFARSVAAWSGRLEGVRFVCADFEETLAETGEGDFVYLDPPYAGSKQRYTRNLEPDRLYQVLDSLNSRGAHWALSFDGWRGERDLTHPVPESLFKRRLAIASGNSAVGKVLNGPVEAVREALYLNY